MKKDFLKFSVVVLCYFVAKCDCKMEPYVVGGNYGAIRNYPHAVFLSVDCGHRWICGASILNQRIVLTAAHCLSGCYIRKYGKHSIQCYAGHENLEKVTTTRTVMLLKVHSGYDEIDVLNDIGLALVKANFPLGNNIKRVIISRKIPEQFQKAFVAGWGIIDDYTEENTLLLKTVNQKIRSMSICARIGNLHTGMFCAGSTYPGSDHPSRGDSGSALMTPNFEAIGLVSYRVNKWPALMVYTNISHYYDWIMRYTKLLYCALKRR